MIMPKNHFENIIPIDNIIHFFKYSKYTQVSDYVRIIKHFHALRFLQIYKHIFEIILNKIEIINIPQSIYQPRSEW